MKAYIINIGDELLYGSTVDTNSVFIAKQLAELGIKIVKKTAVADELSDIIEELDIATEKADLILITGGLGPTKDDITKKTLSKYFESELVQNDRVLAHVEEIFKKFKRPLLPVNIDQALLPECAELLFNEVGTAPGMWIEKNNTIYIAMPGVPFEMKHLMTEQIIPRLKKTTGVVQLIHKFIQTIGIGESHLAEKIAHIEDGLPEHISLAYLPSIGQVKLRLTGMGGDESLEDQLNKIVAQIKPIAQKYIYAYEDITIEEAIGRALTERKETIALAESCTGGYMSHRLTLIPGSSAYFYGSFVTYDYHVKEDVLGVKHETLVNFGAVSEETVSEMLTGCLASLKTTYAIAISGIAGPGGGTPDKPVGTVYIGVANKDGQWIKRHQFRHDRERNIHRSAVVAMDMLRIFMET